MSFLPDPIAAFAVLALLGMLPFLAFVVTSFTKIVVVIGLARNALGVNQAPPSTVINGLAVILSVYIMAPVAVAAYGMAEPNISHDRPISFEVVTKVVVAAKEPFQNFLKQHVNRREQEFFVKSARSLWPKAQADAIKADDMMVLIPAFTVSELTAAFQIGLVIYLAFVVVDFVVAAVLLSLGMSMISPTTVSVPFKLMLFVGLDGWAKLIHGLVLTYR
ncbi:type III secretion system export apparatus subunit SctR [Burkholderia diffusa]|uniref:type III secretion system export apparatus subunit SctR n=1 Tax=Burkholderia diffusa TaxID=488732 RepID=UPI002ED8519F